MPLILPKQRAITREANFSGRPSVTWGTACTSHVDTAHTLPVEYTELIAATTYDTDWVNVTVHTNFMSNTDSDSLLNIYVGAGGAEQILIPNLIAGWVQGPAGGSAGGQTKFYSFPLHVPAGSRLSARHQSVRVNTAVYVMVELLGGGRGDHWTGTQVECVGANTGTSGGTSVTPGTTSDGTLTSMGTNTYEWGFVQPMIGGNLPDTTMNTGYLSADIGSGAATLIAGLDGFLFSTASAEESANFGYGRFALVPASTTVYMRARTSAGAEAMDFCIYGVI